MNQQWRRLGVRVLLVGAIVAASAGAAEMALASHTACDDEGLGGGDVGNDFGPDIVFVGVDALGDPAVCVTSGAPLQESNETVTLNVEDPNPATPGLTVALDRRSCTDQAGVTCTTTSLVGQTGIENPTAAPTSDLPGGGTLGAGLGIAHECLWVNGTANCGPGTNASATVWEGEAPTVTPTGCQLDVPPAGCDVPGAKVSAFGTPNPVARVSRSGVPAVPDGNSDASPDPVCVGVATTCP